MSEAAYAPDATSGKPFHVSSRSNRTDDAAACRKARGHGFPCIFGGKSAHANRLKIRNREYSQWVGREELCERERGTEPDFHVWGECTLACESAQTM
jgi:hypothetical protein